MSNYLQVLRRLESDRTSEPTGTPGARDEWTGEPPRLAANISPGALFPELQLAARQSAYASLLDRLRGSSDHGAPRLVLAGVSPAEPMRQVVLGLQREAAKRGIALRVAELVAESGGRALHLLDGPAPAAGDDPGSLELVGAEAAPRVAAWLDLATAEHDLLVIAAPPLSTGVDAALLAKLCNGLVLIVEAEVTSRHALQATVEKARAAGCTRIGLVLTGAKPWLPRWLRRLAGGSGTP